MPNFLKLISRFLVLITIIAFSGCIKYKDKLSLQKDGSGEWIFSMELNPQMRAMMENKDVTQSGGLVFAKADLIKKLSKIKGAQLLAFEKE